MGIRTAEGRIGTSEKKWGITVDYGHEQNNFELIQQI